MKHLSIMMIFLATSSMADCVKTLALCENYTQALEKERDGLSKILDSQTKRLADAEANKITTPWYEWVLIGAASVVILERFNGSK